ncbi:hypothetical protein CK203_107263 [Vitis vinifera]|uniref:Uncharacterized protein n=1 Tax=Vitis vinifera TaxID=29760 RepID=A0A438BNB2_VITVI|nr:hypothetical protein CK203_107263 [Vitis vinifera]
MWAATSCLAAWRSLYKGATTRFPPFHLQQLGRTTSIQGSIACSSWPITKARSKKIKEALNGLIQEIWADSNAGHSKFGPKEDEGVINLIQDIEG